MLSYILEPQFNGSDDQNKLHNFLDVPIFDAKIDYQFEYHKLFQDNESKL